MTGVHRAHRISPAASLLLLAIHTYRNMLSLLILPCCRMTPSCSTYAREAIQSHGAFHGTWLTARRLLRCQPFSRVWFDPIRLTD